MIIKSIVFSAIVMSGCIGSSPIQQITPPAAKKASYLCVGMEMSGRFGACLGCKRDAEGLASLMKGSFGYRGDVLISEQATKKRVSELLVKGIESTPEDGIFLFFYSGHGGQEWLGGSEPEGSDMMDEYICLYDSHMLDDEIWSIVSKCRGRVFLYFDACHSETLYRSVSSDLSVSKTRNDSAIPLSVKESDMVKSSGFTFRPEKFMKAIALDASIKSPRILCWSGCRETEQSFGSRNGGFLTLAVLNNWSKGCGYGDLWERSIKWVMKVKPEQNPVRTKIGGGFPDDMEAFR